MGVVFPSLIQFGHFRFKYWIWRGQSGASSLRNSEKYEKFADEHMIIDFDWMEMMERALVSLDLYDSWKRIMEVFSGYMSVCI